MEYFVCTACGNEDCIIFTEDVGFCNECGTPEHYELIEEDDNDYKSYREHNRQPNRKGYKCNQN